MSLFAIIKPDNSIMEYRSNLDPKAGTKPGYKILPVIDTDPAYNDATQKKTGPVIKVNADNVTRVWTVTDLTAPELAAILDAKREAVLQSISNSNDIIKALGGMLFDTVNDVRVLKGQGTITAAQFKANLKSRL